MSASNYHYLDVDKILKETDRALLVLCDGEEHWLPLSVVADAANYEVGDENVTLAVAQWFAEKQGWL